MRKTTSSIILSVIFASVYFAWSYAQEATTKTKGSSASTQFAIVPLVAVKPGESKEVLFSTWCTVGATRGGGMSVAEVRDGKPEFEQSTLIGNRTFSKRGVTIRVPDFAEGVAFAASEEFESLRKQNVSPFRMTITAAADAEPGEYFDMHLLDATCAGYCKTDFRVLVVKP